jgi:hypothetical protein
MTITELQKAIGVHPDGLWGNLSRKALLHTFTSSNTAALSADQASLIAKRLGQRQAIVRRRKVEAAGSGFDKDRRPKILFERHKFHKYTGGKYSISSFSNLQSGGYNENSWEKLLDALVTGQVDAAFMACSWGKFQVLGEYWDDFHFASPLKWRYQPSHQRPGITNCWPITSKPTICRTRWRRCPPMRKPAAPLPEPITAPSTSNSIITINWLLR